MKRTNSKDEAIRERERERERDQIYPSYAKLELRNNASINPSMFG